ncbi:c-type cytochrome [Oricola cellulosilytica]|uniref:Cytochrome c n=1 Tax=Oricola cellulosilytica TaxID=1429082 RepID=A0A4R0PG88_9HYPH|nr:cytochrome c [Oricola cellulosilytica]TCD15415.1 cytochrome c [Oricola cellulosilytica]
MKIRTLFGAGAISLSAVAAAFAHGGATGIVKERMDAMGAMGDAIKTLSAMMRGETGYDAAVVQREAGKIETHGGKAMTSLFPEGSDGAPSEAKSEIWSNWKEFEALAVRLESLAAGLERAAENGLAMGNETGMGGSSMMGTGSNMMGTGSNMMGTGSGMMGSGTSSMMSGGGMGSGDSLPDEKTLASMPADGVFNMVAQTCSSCHTKFRLEKN